jgi:hypothetical protein
VAQGDLEGSRYEFLSEERTAVSAERKARLPYVFSDPHRMDKKIDPRKLTFGSKITEGNAEREEFFTIKETLSAERVRLNNDLMIRLIGVRERMDEAASAKAWLEGITKGQRVFLRYDQEKHDDAGCLFAYLYLKNKTFLNAHLVKRGLADVDLEQQFKYKERFERYAQEIEA